MKPLILLILVVTFSHAGAQEIDSTFQAGDWIVMSDLSEETFTLRRYDRSQEYFPNDLVLSFKDDSTITYRWLEKKKRKSKLFHLKSGSWERSGGLVTIALEGNSQRGTVETKFRFKRSYRLLIYKQVNGMREFITIKEEYADILRE